MASKRTLSIIKPDATRRNLTGAINKRFEEAGLAIVAQRRTRLTPAQAKAFYAVHAERSFYEDLCAYMASGPVVVQVLEGENAIALNRRGHGRDQPGQRRRGAPSARISANRSRPIPCMARIPPKPPRRKSPSSSRKPTSLADRAGPRGNPYGEPDGREGSRGDGETIRHGVIRRRRSRRHGPRGSRVRRCGGRLGGNHRLQPAMGTV